MGAGNGLSLPAAGKGLLSVTVEKCTYLMKPDMVLDMRWIFDLAHPTNMVGSSLPTMESPLHLGLRRVTRRAGAERRSRRAA